MRKVVIASPVQTQSGYGHHAREVISNLIQQKGSEWDIKLISLPWGHTPLSYPIPADWKSRLISPQMTEQPDIWVQITVPNEFQRVGKFNIGVTAGTEGSVCPPEWIDKLNQFELTVVPSEFTKKVFEDTAKNSNKLITTNIQVVAEYFDDQCYDNTKPLNEIVGLADIAESFAFLSVGHWLSGNLGQDRKDISGLIHTFFNTFKNQTSAPALILKTSGATYSVTDRFEIENKIGQIRDLHKGDRLPNIYLLHGDLTDDEMNSLYNHPKVKAMISFTKGEGFGRPLLEFSTTGKPIIAPHYSGPADFLNKDFICALPGGLTPIDRSAQNQFLIKEASWHTVDYGYASKMMKEVKKNYKKWLELAKRQRYYAISNFSKNAVSKRYTELIEIVDKGTASIPIQQELKLPKLNLPKLQKI
jgi:glycosyltransferase involved in cell wall biosynthesis